MKKLLFPLLMIGVLLSSCKKDDPKLGTVSVSPTTATLSYGQTVTISPSFSEDGLAKDKTYNWITSNDTVASVTTVLGGKGEVTAKRVGVATITYKATDKSLSATTTVTVEARTNILGNLYFKKGASKTVVQTQEMGTLNDNESTSSTLVYDRTTTNVVKVIKVIYQFDANNTLLATYGIVEDDAAGKNRTNVQYYIEERFEKTATIKNLINYYKAYVGPLNMYEKNTMIGAFIDNNPNTGLPTDLTYSLGVKIVDNTNM
ncbi:MAG: Ig domain-containing protein [Paludibacteraceae bacterium]